MALRKKTTRKNRRTSRKSRSGGGMKMDMDRIVDPDDYKIDPRNHYYLKLGTFQYFDDNDYPVFEQNGQFYTINPQESIIFKDARRINYM
jgi:hypothetical protein